MARRLPTYHWLSRASTHVREYSDILLIFLLKALRPDKYRERVEVRGSLASIDLNRLTDEQLARISAGDHPLSVIGGRALAGAAT